jgi:hypothetical protein
MYSETDLNGQIGLVEMAAEDWIPFDFIDEEEYDESPRRHIPTPQAEFQDEKDSWRMADKYVPVNKLMDSHLLNCIHMVERKAVNNYDPAPKVYLALVREARKRNLIKR